MARLARFNSITATAPPLTAQTDPFPFETMRARYRRALLMSPSLRAPAVRVALVVLEHANREHFNGHGTLEAWPDRDTLAELTGRRLSTTKDALYRLLREKVVFFPSGQPGGHGARDSNRYCFNNRWLDQTEGELASLGLLRKWPDNRLKGAESRPHAKGAEIRPDKGAETRQRRGRKSGPETR